MSPGRLLFVWILLSAGLAGAQDEPVSAVDSLAAAVPVWHDLTIPSKEYARELDLRKKLDQVVSVDFEGVLLIDALPHLLKPLGVQFVIAEQEITEDGGSADVQIHLTLTDIPAWQALELMLEQHDLSWYPDDAIVMITTLQYVESKLITRVYDVEPLLKLDLPERPRSVQNYFRRDDWSSVPWSIQHLANAMFASASSPEQRERWTNWLSDWGLIPLNFRQTAEDIYLRQLSAAIQYSTSGVWSPDAGVGGTISIVGRRLVIRQTHNVHQEVREILRAAGEVLSGSAVKPQSFGQNPDAGSEAVQRALSQPVTLHVKEMSLRSVLHILTRRTGIQFFILENEIQQDDGSVDVQITVGLDNVPLETVLRQILQPHQLTYIHRNNLLTVTAVTAAGCELYSVVYDLTGICPVDAPIPVIQAVQEATSGYWEDSIGGNISHVFGRLLLIRQTAKVHREIEQLLDALRLANQREAAAKK